MQSMTTDAYLWAIFALLCLALALVVITARRCPWSKPPVRVIHEARLHSVGIDHRGLPLMHVKVLRESVDPLWGKNPPVEDHYIGVVGIDPDALRESQARWPKAPTVADLMKDEW